MDKKHRSIWYYAGLSFAYGVNYTTGKVIFLGNTSFEESCISHDHRLNRTFAITFNPEFTNDSTVFLTELYPLPKKEKVLLTLPPGLGFGSCSYDQETKTLIVLMTSVTDYITEEMPTEMVLIDVVNLTSKRVPLPGFKKWSSRYPITAVKFIPNVHSP